MAVLAVLFFPAAPVAADRDSGAGGFEISKLVIDTAKGRVTFSVEIAASNAQRIQGLQGRGRLGAKQGMLFDFAVSQPVAMWMKNTIIPLDMLFIANDGKIVRIARDTTPMSLTTIYSREPVRAVLEINAGTSEAMGIHTGDRVIDDIFTPK